uniref:Uncharacterized protein n=1 Tax=Grammatophora oceanica TaxID=210454 RepID=A0A7S1VWS9_9STRA|mmetsp:Transcript_8266/g.12071  ORF Transcript_8266/g.12071 Transcript_8266/m.12071 type:complete len:209 (+) Transcript_8266:46-672(+)|eukprot:CAMPEP_0194033874 /NCGR_PEP_ID=MMETSP0009_2-20130614/6374_1 /TAXON_ID=210454 /ORGANISM="Grammatophora oceanica, Strain CCMP 410" /LENGTH=208 /DNA_ID=CAMNT_0038674605 /DNA_START=39 /DNA_END=665 /DNA_ORIENTATION=+
MGVHHSKFVHGGRLPGAHAPHVKHVADEHLPKPGKSLTVKASVPPSIVERKRKTEGNESIVVALENGDKIPVNVPKGLRAGEEFTYTMKENAEIEKVFASTLPSIPGMEVVCAKPILWATVTFNFTSGRYDNARMGTSVGSLLQEAQAKILEQVIHAKCNACLGMSFSITNDSTPGEKSGLGWKVVIVTACGTPAIVIPRKGRAHGSC